MAIQSVRIPIELELKNMQGAINTLKNALSNVSKNSGISTEINKDLDRVQKKFNELQAIASRPFTKVSDLNSFQNQLTKLGDSVNLTAEKFKGIQFKDIDLSKIQGAEATFKKLQAEVTAAEEKARNFTNVEFSKMAADPNALKGVIENFQNVFGKGKAPILDTSSFEKSFEIIKSKLAELIKAKDEYDAKMSTKKADFEQATAKYSNITQAEEELKRIQAMSDQSGDSQRKALENFKTKYAESAKQTNLTVEDYLKAYFGIDLKLFNEAKQTKAQIDAEIQRNLDSNAAGSFKKVKASASRNVVNAHEQMGATENKLNTINSELQVAQDTKNAFTGAQEGMVPGLEAQIAAAEQAKKALEAYQAQILQTVNATQSAKGAAGAFGNAIASTQGQIAQAENRLRMLNEQARKMDQFKSRMAMWFGFTRIMSTVRRVVNAAAKEIRELDKVMTQIAVVTKMSQEDLWNQIDAYTAIAKQYGVATRGVYEVSQIYYQQGLQTADVMDLTSETLKMAKIASLDYATAADYMTVAVRGFKMEMSDAQVVTDVYSALAANTASSTKELATAMSKTASSAEAVGSSFESTSAMIATMIATTRESATNIGSAMKSIISRYGEMTSDPTKLVDSEGEEMSLNRVDKALQSIGITLQTTNGQFRDFDEVILELAQKWDTVDRNTQRYIATIMAGNRQQSRFLALVGNYDEYARALDVAANAEDTGTLQTLKTMDSLETKIQGVKTAWEQFYNSMGIEKIAKSGLGTITKMFNNLSKMNKPAAFATIINLFKGLKTMITGISSGVTGIFQKMQGSAQNSISLLKNQLASLEQARTINLEIAQASAQLDSLIAKRDKLSSPVPVNLSTALTSGQFHSVPRTRHTKAALNLNSSTPHTYGKGANNSGVISRKVARQTGVTTSTPQNSRRANVPTGVVFSNKANKNVQQGTSGIKKLGETSVRTSDKMDKGAKDTQESTQQVSKSFTKTVGFLNVFGSALQTAGAMITAHALTLVDTSTDKYEKSKTRAAGGSFLSAAGSALTSGGSAMMMTGNWVVAIISAIVSALPGLTSGFSQLIDGFNYTAAERWATSIEEAEKSQNESVKKRGETTSLKSSVKNLQELSEAQYNSTEAAEEYKNAMNTMAESYPDLISYYDSAGNAIIDLSEAEEKLTQLRYEAAVAARQAQKDEVERRKNELKTYQDAKNAEITFETPEIVVEEDFTDTKTRIREEIERKIADDKAAAIRDGVETYADVLNYGTEKNYYAETYLNPNSEYGETGVGAITLYDYVMSDDLEISEEEESLYAMALQKTGIWKELYQSTSGEDKSFSFETLTLSQLAEFDPGAVLGPNAGEFYKEMITKIAEDTQKDIYSLSGLQSDSDWDNLTSDQIINSAKLVISQLNGYAVNAEHSIQLAADSLARADMESFARENALSGNEKEIEEHLGLISSLGGEMLESWTKDYNLEQGTPEKDVEDYIDENSTEYSKQRELFFGQIMESDLSTISNIYDNVLNYSSKENYESAIISAGVELESDLGQALVAHFIESTDTIKNRTQKAIRKNISGENRSKLAKLFGGTDIGDELLVGYSDSVITAVNLIDEYTEKGLLAKAEALENSVVGLYTSLGSQSDEVQNDVLAIVKNIDWESATSIQSAIDAMSDYTDAENINLDGEIDALQAARDKLAFNLSTEIQMMTDAITKGIEGMEKTISSQTKGMGLDDALSAFRTITAQEEYQDASFDELIEYDATLKQWVYKQEGFAAAIGAQTETIENSRKSASKAYDKIADFSKWYVHFSEEEEKFITNQGIGADNINNALKEIQDSETVDWSTFMSGAFEDNAFAQEQILAYRKTDQSEKTFTEWLAEQVNLNELEWKAAQAIYEAWGENIVNLLSAGIDIEKIMSGTDAENQKSILQQIIAENYKKQHSNVTEEFAKKYAEGMVDNIYQAIQKGDLSKLGEQIDITDEMFHAAATTPAELANNAIEELMGGLDTVLSAETVQYLRDIQKINPADYGIKEENGAWILSTTEASADLLNLLLEVPGESLEEQNEYLAKAYEHLAEADDAAKRADLVDKTSVTFEDLSELAALRGTTLNTLFDQDSGRIAISGLKYNDFTGEFDITNFDAYWDAVTGSLEKNTVEYLEAYSAWVEDYLEKENMVKEEAQTQLDDLLDASLYEKINVAFLNAAVPNLENYLGKIENGMAVVDENTNFLGLLQKLEAMEASGVDVIEDSVGEIRDKITELIESWADAISAGLTGELGATDAEKLKAQFGLTDADFTETKKGLEISRQTAFELYEQIKKIAPLQAELIFDQLSESLVEAGEGYEDVASVMGRIAEINKELANVPVGDERRKELERELAVAEEILRVRSQDPESFNFMDKELPTGMQGPENYWNSVGQAYQAMNEAASSGYMEIQDYVNVIRQMEAMALAAGQEFEMNGMNASQLIQAGMNALTNVDGEGAKVAIEGLGIDFANAATDAGLSFDDGIKEMAKSQIKMLDASIRMLEAMVAMEDIDINKNGLFDLEEIFDGENFTSSANSFINRLDTAAGGIEINGLSLKEALLSLDPNTVADIFNKLKNIDWTLGGTDIFTQIQNILNAFYPGAIISTKGPSIFELLKIPDTAAQDSKEFQKWAEEAGVNAEHANRLINIMKLGGNIGTIESKNYKVIEQILELTEKEKELFKTFATSDQDKNLSVSELQMWSQIGIEVDAEGNLTGASYTASDGSIHQLGTDPALWQTEIAQVEELITIASHTGQETLKATGNLTTVTLTNGTKVEGVIEVVEGGIKASYNGKTAILTKPSEAYDWIRKQAELEMHHIGETGGTTTTVTPTGEMKVIPKYTVTGEATEETKQSVTDLVNMSYTDAQKWIDENKQLSEDGKTFTLPNIPVEFAEGTDASYVQQIVDSLFGEGTFDTLPSKIAEGITQAFSGESGQAIGTAISTGLATALGGEQNVDGIPISELTLKPTGLKIDTTDIQPVLMDGLAGTEESPIGIGDIGVVSGTASTLKITSLPSEGELVKDENADGNQIVDIGEVETKADASNLAITIPDDLTPEAVGVIERFNDAVKSAQTNGLVQTGVEDNTKINPLVLLKIIALKEALTQIQNNPEVKADIKAEATGTALAVVKDLLAVYGISGETAELIFNSIDQDSSLSSIQDSITEILNGGEIKFTSSWTDKNEREKEINELTKPEEKVITLTYTTNPTVGPGLPEGQKEGYILGQKNNMTGDYQQIGSYKNLEELIANAASDAYGTVSGIMEDSFQITEITSEGNLTITAPLSEITSGTISFSNNDSINNGSPTETSNNGVNSPTPATPLDLSPLSAAIELVSTSAATAVENITAAATSLTSIDMYPAELAEAKIRSLSRAIVNIPTNGSSKIGSITTAIKNIPSDKEIEIHYKIKVDVEGGANATGRISNAIGVDSFGPKSASGSLVKGTVNGTALASGTRRTLMGELGPELVVSGGRYFVVGQSGAEFVDLADDAIVFNHLQTQRLLKNGHAGTGKPVTNERKATSLVTGNVGPAKASASDALAQLREIRAMWQAMLEATAQDLGSKAGSGGGGGGGGGGGEDIKAVTGELERWYNLLRQIESLEKHITLEQAKRANMLDGYKYTDSLEKELEMLKEQQKAYKLLSELQKDYYDRRREDLLSTDYSKIFTYTEHGLMQYVDGENRGLDILAKLNERDATGKLINNAVDAKAQIKYLQSIGFDTSILKNNEDGTKAENEEGMMENFWNGVDGWMEELDGLYDSYHDAITDFEESTEKMNEILQEYIDNQLSVEEKLRQAIEDREQAEIDKLEKEREVFEEASQEYIDGLSEALSKEQDLYNKNETNEETAKMQRRLAILQRSGGSASEIKSLQDQIDSRLKDAYFQEQQDQIDAIQEASDKQIEKLQTQIDLMTETLEYQKENGLLWNEVYEMMNQWTPEQMLQFIEQYTKSYQENSALQNQEDSKETLKELQIYTGKRDLDERNAAWAEYYKSLTAYSEEIKKANADAAQSAFNSAYATGGLSAGKAAADKVFEDAKTKADELANQEAEEKENVSNTPTTPIGSQTGSVNGGTMNVRASASAKSNSQGRVGSGRSFVAVGYKNGWLKVIDADVGNGKKVSGYMKYSNYERYYKGIDIKNLPAFMQGGLVDFTGPAMVHGTKSKPEAFLSASDTAMLKSKIFSNSDGSLKSLVAALEKITNDTSRYNGEGNSAIIIENAQVNIQPGVISSDYDARRAGEMALEEMVKIARKTTNRVISR